MNKYQEALEAVYKDLLMRASFNTFHNDGELVVEVGAGVWFKVCDALGKTSDERTREDLEEGRDLITISLSANEKSVLEELSTKQELSHSRLMAQALATYQLHEAGMLKPLNAPPENIPEDEWFASLPQELRDSINVLDLRAIPQTAEDAPDDDWELEQRAFAFANDQTLPVKVRQFIQDLWKTYCVSSSLEDAASIAENLWRNMAGTQNQHQDRESYGKSVAVTIRQRQKDNNDQSFSLADGLAKRLAWCADAPNGVEFTFRKASLTRHDIRQSRDAVQRVYRQIPTE